MKAWFDHGVKCRQNWIDGDVRRHERLDHLAQVVDVALWSVATADDTAIGLIVVVIIVQDASILTTKVVVIVIQNASAKVVIVVVQKSAISGAKIIVVVQKTVAVPAKIVVVIKAAVTCQASISSFDVRVGRRRKAHPTLMFASKAARKIY